ncbi:MAG: hypothetical protein NC489_20815 [Ruminococcus flavefaciens]|nr:hypothetical protein [Roseburia sp.]MCM1232574.1 hypothetical protein [Ruminococcus flavefaciens]
MLFEYAKMLNRQWQKGALHIQNAQTLETGCHLYLLNISENKNERKEKL